MIRAFAFVLLFLFTSVHGVDVAHGWSHVAEATHDQGHAHEHDHEHESCELCDWESVVVPEPWDAIEVPRFVAISMPLAHDESLEERLNPRVHRLELADRGPPENN